MAIKGFDKAYYLSAKLDQLQNDPATAAEWAGKDAAFLEEKLINGFGLTAESHYEQYGYQEGLAPNAFFDSAEYIRAKAVQMVNDTSTSYTNVAEAEAAFVEIWGGNVYLHYLEFGEKENVNPSNDFDVSSYLDAKLAALQAEPETAEEWADKTTADLTATFETANLTALEHFLAYGQDEDLEAPAVPADERVEVDAQNPGQVFTLTIGEDSGPAFTGGAGNDTFNAPIVQDNSAGTVETLESFDVLDGGAGTDTLNATIDTATPAAVLKNIENVNGRFVGAGVLDLANATGVEVVTIANSAAAGQIDSVGTIANLVVKNQTQDAAFDGSTAATLNVSLESFGKSTATNDVDLGAATSAEATKINYSVNNAYATVNDTGAAAAVTTVTVAATGTNVLDLIADAATAESVTVTGTGSVDLIGATPTAFTALTKFDASANEGGVKADIQSAAKAVVTGGKGDDVIRMDTNVVSGTTVALGAGNDALYVGDLLENFASVDGGEGTDIINITDAADFTTTNLANVSGFEVLDVSGGTGTYDLSLKAFETVQIDEAVNGVLGGDVVLDNVATGFTLNVASEAEAGADFDVTNDVTIQLKTDGKADVVNLAYTINDGDKSGTAEGIAAQTVTIADVETINIDANVGLIDGDSTIKAADHIVTFTSLVIDDAKTLDIDGDASVVFTGLTNTNNTLNKVDASGSTGDITLDAAALTASINYTGSAGVDIYNATTAGDTIYTGKGADVVALDVAKAAADVFVLKAATDSQIVDTDDSGKILLDGNDLGFDSVSNFTIAQDKIDLLSFNFSGAQRGVVDVSSIVDATTDLTSVADLFSSAGGDRGVAIYDDGSTNTYVFVDANKDGDFTAADDLVIQVVGTGLGITASDFNI